MTIPADYLQKSREYLFSTVDDVELVDQVLSAAYNYEISHGGVSDEDDSNRFRCMINQLYRFCNLADEVSGITRSPDALRIFFLRVSIETICNLCNSSNKKKNFYSDYLSESGKSYISAYFHITQVGVSDDSIPHLFLDDIIKDGFNKFQLFETIFFGIRNSVVHRGECWDNRLFVKGEYPIMSSFVSYKKNESFGKFFEELKNQTKEDYLEEIKIIINEPKRYITYESSLNYEQFKKYHIDACLRYILQKINEEINTLD